MLDRSSFAWDKSLGESLLGYVKLVATHSEYKSELGDAVEKVRDLSSGQLDADLISLAQSLGDEHTQSSAAILEAMK